MVYAKLSSLACWLAWSFAISATAAHGLPPPPDSLTCVLGVNALTRTQAGLGGDVAETRVRTFTLDLRDGRRVPVSENVSAVERRTYRPDGRLDTVEQAGGFDLVTYAYDASGRPLTITRGGPGRPALAARTDFTYANDSARLVDLDTAGQASLYRFQWPEGADELDGYVEYLDRTRGPTTRFQAVHHVCATSAGASSTASSSATTGDSPTGTSAALTLSVDSTPPPSRRTPTSVRTQMTQGPSAG